MATYKVGADGKAPTGLQAGDQVVTAAGTYTIQGVKADGSYDTGNNVPDKSQTTSNYTGQYATNPTPAPKPQTTGGGQTSASSNANKQTTAPAGYTGSATSVGVHTEDQDAIRAQMNANSKAWYDAPDGDENTPGTKQWLHAENQKLAAKLGGSVDYDETTGTWSGSAQKEAAVPQMPTLDPNAGQGLKGYLDSWLVSAQEQSAKQIDYATQQGITELQRAEEDAKVQFQTQRDQVSRDERIALDNSALYSEARGDRGGIGEAQYDTIMANAAKNRLAVNQAQTKLSTDTARQIADLRAQGEFQKADQLLALTQTYLSQLMQLEQWGLEYALSVTQFNAEMQQWNAEFELSLGELMGTYQGSPTLSAQKADESKLASAGEALLSVGVMPSESQLAAMGMTRQQAQDYITAAKIAAASKKTSGGGNGNGSGTEDYEGLMSAASTAPSPENFIRAHFDDYGFENYAGLIDYYNETWAPKREEWSTDTSLWTAEEKQASAMASAYLARTDTRGKTREDLLDDLNAQGYSSLAQQFVLLALGFNISDLF